MPLFFVWMCEQWVFKHGEICYILCRLMNAPVAQWTERLPSKNIGRYKGNFVDVNSQIR